MFRRLHSQAFASLIAAAPVFCAAPAITEGASFQNLDFESANLLQLQPGESGGFVPISQALPGWNAYRETTPVNVILYNQGSLGGSVIAIQSDTSLFGPVLEGRFTAHLVAGVDEFGTPTSASLSQIGFVPEDSQSILLKASGGNPFLPRLTVSFNNQTVSLIPLETAGNVTLFGADVSGWAGTTADLRLTADPFANVWVDAISFSPVPVPEPSTWALLGVGLLCFAGFVRGRLRPR